VGSDEWPSRCSAAGYATALYGKWHLGSNDGRLPNDQGFDEWYGIPRTTDESMWPGSPGYSAAVLPPEQILEGRKGEKSRALKVYDLEQRRLIDAEITRRTVAFMERQAGAKKPFFAYATLTQPHLPTLPNPAFAGKTGNGDWATCWPRWTRTSGRWWTRSSGWASARTRS
jgi:arylsulfatase